VFPIVHCASVNFDLNSVFLLSMFGMMCDSANQQTEK
jgi:hypothetical protein